MLKRIIQGLALFCVIVGIIAFYTLPRYLWIKTPTRSLPLLIVDKTVPETDYREHQGLIWTLNHFKIQPPKAQESWTAAKNYLGYEPPADDQPPPMDGPSLTDQDVADKSMLFIADSYGVYRQDFHVLAEPDPQESKRKTASPDYSKKIYGGFDLEEAQVIEDFAAEHPVWGEFNTFASPTHGEARARLEKLFGVKWTGWAGRYFVDLANESEIPAWARRNWKAHKGSEWSFEGQGWLLVHEDSRIEVLQIKQDIPSDGLKFYHTQPDHPLLENTFDAVPFYYWFDILELDGAQELAEYRFELKDSGRAILEQAGIPLKFPALMQASQKPLRLYFAGDASDQELELGRFRVKHRMKWKRALRNLETSTGPQAFFWEFYLPLMGNVLDAVAGSPEQAEAAS